MAGGEEIGAHPIDQADFKAFPACFLKPAPCKKACNPTVSYFRFCHAGRKVNGLRREEHLNFVLLLSVLKEGYRANRLILLQRHPDCPIFAIFTFVIYAS